MSPHRNRSRSTSNPHVNQAVRYHHDGHATGRAKAKLRDRPSVDLLNGGGHQLLPPGPLTHRHTPSRRRQGYDKAAVSSTNLPPNISQLLGRPRDSSCEAMSFYNTTPTSKSSKAAGIRLKAHSCLNTRNGQRPSPYVRTSPTLNGETLSTLQKV